MSAEAETNKSSNLEVQVEKLVYGGAGLSRSDGRVVLVPFVLPGETAKVAPVQSRKDLVRARLLEVTNPSAERMHPKCPYFGRCGGCDYQHTTYQFQLVQKQAILREVFERIGHIPPPESIEVVSAEPWLYRNRTQLHVANGQLGYLEAKSHKLCAIDHCPISSPKLNECIGVLRTMMRDRRFPRFVQQIELFTNEAEVQINVLGSDQPVARRFFDWFAEQVPGTVSGPLSYTAGGHTYRVGGSSFFQVNRFLVERLVDAAVGADKGTSAVDLYAGVGLFSLRLAAQFEQVTAVEAHAGAADDLQHNAERAGLAVRAIRQQVESFLMEQEDAPDFVLADPPRAGLGKLVVKELLRLKPKRLTIIACDPTTLARDLSPLLAGGYEMRRVALVDLFPQTYHMETVVELGINV